MPEQCLNNELIQTDITDGRFITFVLLDLDLTNNRCNLLAGGDARTLFFAAGSAKSITFAAQRLSLGIFPDADLDEVHA